MFTIRRAEDRGQTELSWLDSRHSFSFGDYYDPAHMGFRTLRVINDDRVAPGGGFGRHPHRDMEIISYVVEGALEHKDSMGNGSVIRAGDVQRMSAGRGVLHSEFNASDEAPVRFLQIWIPPLRRGVEPSYDQRHFDERERRGQLRLLAGPDADQDALSIDQDARLYGTLLEPGERVVHSLESGRHAWVQVVNGAVEINGTPLREGDGLAASDVRDLDIRASEAAELLLFDLG